MYTFRCFVLYFNTFKYFLKDRNKTTFTFSVPRTIRVDKGTETGVMAEMQCQFHVIYRTFGDDIKETSTKAVRYGPSTANKIERFWRDLHERFEGFFKEQLADLVDRGYYDSTNHLDR